MCRCLRQGESATAALDAEFRSIGTSKCCGSDIEISAASVGKNKGLVGITADIYRAIIPGGRIYG